MIVNEQTLPVYVGKEKITNYHAKQRQYYYMFALFRSRWIGALSKLCVSLKSSPFILLHEPTFKAFIRSNPLDLQ